MWAWQIDEYGKLPTQSANDDSVTLREVIAAMSHALDLTGGQPKNHAIRTAIISTCIAREAGLNDFAQSHCFYAALLKDLGCSSNAARMCAIFQADERDIKHDIRLIDWTRQLTTARFSLGHASPGGSFNRRLKAVVGIAANKQELSQGLIRVRCERGAELTTRLGFPVATANAILALDEHWCGSGQPLGLRGENIPIEGRIISLAQTIDTFFAEHGIDAACELAQNRSGKWFDPALVKIFLSLAKQDELTIALNHEYPERVLYTLEPDSMRLSIDEAHYDRVAMAFSEVIDAKSPWTLLHSNGVAMIATGIARTMGFTQADQLEIRRAGLLHDIGKLGVSNLVLDKPGKLTESEFAEMRSHALHSQRLLSRVRVFERFADYASAHHERVDGQGYHRRLEEKEIATEAKILAVADVCEALTADRPYRRGMPADKVLEIISADAGTAFCPEVVEAFMQFQSEANLFSRLSNRHVTASLAA